MLGLITRAAVLFLAACGRIAFAPHDDAGAALGDGDAAPAQVVYVAHSVVGVTSQIYTLDVLTGRMTLVGEIDAVHGELTALAYRDANTLYAFAYQGELLEVTLSPFAIRVLGSNPLATIVGAELGDNGDLVCVDEGGNEIVTVTPEPYQFHPSFELVDQDLGTPIDQDGGDLVRISDTQWLVSTNLPSSLYRIDATTGLGPRLGPTLTNAAPYVVGLSFVGPTLYGITRDTNALVEIDPLTGTFLSSKTLCVSCPTPFDLDFGDMTASPN